MKAMYDILRKAGTAETESKDWGYLPYILSIIANCLWPIAWVYCNQNKVSFAQSTMARGIVIIIVSYIACYYDENRQILRMKDNFKLLAVRSIVMSLHSFGTGIGQFILPLPILHTIACSGTLFVFIIDYFLNSTPINARQIIGIAVGIFGVLLTSNGKLITQYFDPTYQYNTTYQNYLITDPNLVALFAIVYFLIVVGWAYGIVLTKSAKANVFQINLILGFAFYFESVLVLPCMPYLDYRQSSLLQFGKVVAYTGVPLLVVAMLVNCALTMTKQTGVLNMMNFSMVAVSYLISIIRYQETPNFISSIGILLVAFGVWKTLFNKTQNE